MRLKPKQLLLIVGITSLVLLSFNLEVLLKIKDPNNPKFNKQEFSFEDYNHRDLSNALSILLAKGTPMAEVDQLLETTGKAIKTKTEYVPSENIQNAVKAKNAYTYGYSVKQSWLRDLAHLRIYPFNGYFIRIEYDDKNKIKQYWLQPS